MLPLLNETKYQSHVRVRVRFRSGVCRVHGSCPVRVWVRVWIIVRVCVWFATGFVSVSCPVRVRVRVRFVSGFVSGSCLASVWGCFVSGFVIGFMFGFVSGFVSAGSCRVRVWCIFGSRLVRIWIRMRFSFGFSFGVF